ncbi:MAG: LysR family transcriptional regulator [Kofleriaceae bacterium]
MHIAWDDLQLVLAIAEAGSLSGAARRLRVTQPTASRRLAELEEVLGEPLFVRRVDGTAATSFGERLIEPARRMAESAAEVERAAERVERAPRGTVRITAPPGIASAFLAPFAAALRTRLPEIRLEVISTVRYVDLVRREADLALRIPSAARREAPRDIAIVATVAQKVLAVATPAYLATRKRGYGFADVDWIGWPPPLDDTPPMPQLAARIPSFQPVFASDDFLVQLRAAEQGVGALVLSDLRTRFDPPPTLVPLALVFRGLTSTLQLACARGSLAVPRIAAVAELIAAELAPKSVGRRVDRGIGRRR